MKKTLIITYKPSATRGLIKTLCKETHEKYAGCFENDFYIITYILMEYKADHICIPFDHYDEESLNDSLERLVKTKYCTILGGLSEKYLQKSKTILALVSRKDIDRIIWYAPTHAPFLTEFSLFYRLVDRQDIKHSFYFESEGLECFLPMNRLKTERIMRRYYEAMRCSCIRESLISSYFSKTIEMIYNALFKTDEYVEVAELDDFDVLIMKSVYEKPDKFYTSGFLTLHMEELTCKGVPKLFDFLPLCRYVTYTNISIEKIINSGLMKQDPKRLTIMLTEYGRRIYGIIKEYLPYFADVRRFKYWRNRANKIIQGKMSGEEYIEEAYEYVKKTISDIHID